jgi:hypothetical protein
VKFPRATRLLILCQTKRSLDRCKQRMMSVLKERRLGLSSKKTRIGCIKKGFHFLGTNYLGTQPSDNINVAKALLHSEKQGISAHYLTLMGGGQCVYGSNARACNYRSTFKNIAQSTRASKTNGYGWGLSSANQQLLTSLGHMVGKNFGKLDLSRRDDMVYKRMLGRAHCRYRPKFILPLHYQDTP